MITFIANAREAKYMSGDVITSGSVGIPVTVSLSADFDGLSCIMVFQGSGQTLDVALAGSRCVVPHEVLTAPGGYLRIGVYARDVAGAIVIPTVWAASSMILQGAAPSGVDPSEPTPDWTAQVQQQAATALENSEQATTVANQAQQQAATALERGLPEITAEDEGKVLTVENGVATWKENEGGGSGGAGYTEEDVLTTIYQDQALQFSENHGFGYASIGILSSFDITKNATIVWDGEPYTCEPTVDEYGNVTYGGGISEQGPDFTQYPFVLEFYNGLHAQMYCSADNLGGHSVAIKQMQKHVTAVSNGFKEAVRDSFFLSFDIGLEAGVGETVYRTSEELGVTLGDIIDMFQGKGGMVFMRSDKKVSQGELLEICRRMVSYSDFDGEDILRFEKEDGVSVTMTYNAYQQAFRIDFYS